MTDQNTPSVTILPETTESILYFSVTGVVTKEDYIEYIYKPMSDIRQKQEHFRVLAIIEEGFLGMTEDAAETDLAHRLEGYEEQKADKVAMVIYNPVHKQKMQPIELFMKSGEFKIFNGDELDIAKKWIFEE